VSAGAPRIGLERIMAVLPHRPPFLFVDEVLRLNLGVSITARRTLRPEEPHFAGHFPGRPVMPGVLVTEALAQTCGSEGPELDSGEGVFYVLAAENIKYASAAGQRYADLEAPGRVTAFLLPGQARSAGGASPPAR
jgi:3-hydroxymyristoyl/3-hydroxydecanoyl-(acyl carrier protein) dehydratase